MATKKVKREAVEGDMIETPEPVESNAKAVVAVDYIDVLSRTLLIGLLFLLPLFFLPASVAVMQTAKMFLVYGVSIVLSLIALIQVLRRGVVHIPLHSVLVTGVLVVVGYVIAGIFSKNPNISLFGRDLGPDSVMAVLAFFAIGVAAAKICKDRLNMMYVYSALCVSGAVVIALHLINVALHFFIVRNVIPASALSWMGIFTSPILNTVGKWNELGLFAVLILMVVLLGMQYVQLAKSVRAFLYVTISLSMVLIVLVNFSLVWWILALFTLGLGVAHIVTKKKKQTAIFSTTAGIFALSVVFILFGNTLGAHIAPAFAVQNIEVRPSLEATTDIAQSALSGARTVFGVGPGLFENEWQQFRPLSVLPTNFWNVDFRFGFGLIPTFVVTTGLMGALTWVLFLVALAVLTIKALRYTRVDAQDRFLLIASVVTVWFSWIVVMFYLPTTTLITYATLFTGLFVAATIKLGVLNPVVFEPKGIIPQRALYGIVILIIAGTVLLGVKVILKSAGHVSFQQSLTTLGRTGDVLLAETYLVRASQLDPIDIYAQSRAEIAVVKLQKLFEAGTAEGSVDPAQFQQHAGAVVSAYEQAIAYDPQNYMHYNNLATFYTSLATIGVSGVYDVAKANFGAALERKPNNPLVFLSIAQLEFANGNIPATQAAVDKALELKSNYGDAYLFLTQVELSQGSQERAIGVLMRAGANNPSDPFIYFQLGLLQYDAGMYDDAVLALERAVSLNPDFQNAKYFLGLSYFAVGQTDSAVRQFETLVHLNPENGEVATMLERLRRGESPILASEPLETLDELPLEEGNVEVGGEVEAIE
jgi:tetratricopeptide (TPR) repeat protein